MADPVLSDWPGDHSPGISLTDEEMATIVRRRRAKANPYLWRIGGSISTDGHTIYCGERFVGMCVNPVDAAYFVKLANEAQATPAKPNEA